MCCSVASISSLLECNVIRILICHIFYSFIYIFVTSHVKLQPETHAFRKIGIYRVKFKFTFL